MSISFSRKCDLLAEVHVEASWNDELNEFRKYNDVGLPLSYLLSIGMVELKGDEGRVHIEETWELLCEALEVDNDTDYSNIDEMISKSKYSTKQENDKEEEEE
jgi:hypothetical protein